jgi:hypothetical protein
MLHSSLQPGIAFSTPGQNGLSGEAVFSLCLRAFFPFTYAFVKQGKQ